MDTKVRKLFEEWWARLAAEDRSYFIEGVRAGRQDQRMVSLITDRGAPIGPVYAAWSGQGYEVQDLGPAAEFVESLPEYQAS